MFKIKNLPSAIVLTLLVCGGMFLQSCAQSDQMYVPAGCEKGSATE